MRKTRTSTAVKSRYNDKAYDRFHLTVPKGQKAVIAAAAEAAGESTNTYIQRAILDRMGLDGWRKATDDERGD